MSTQTPDQIAVPGRIATPPDPDRWKRRGPASEQDLKWKRQRMVRWFSPGQLALTGVRAVLSSVFGAYADRRELQAALHQHEMEGDPAAGEQGKKVRIYRYADKADPTDGFWIDYVADLGDGFRPTHGVAWLLAQPTLPVPPAGSEAAVERPRNVGPEAPAAAPPGQTRRGRILVMGGDQVYPTASRDEYDNRLVGPYEAALTCHPVGDHPHLYAIPGNHDWYDGLTSFIRLFCQGNEDPEKARWIGAWQTRQSRSYFALQLPGRWWLLGTDVQLQADIDKPQLEYFCEVAKEMQPGDRVILCTAEPAWVHTQSNPAAFDNLAFFEKTVLPEGVELALTLTGDLHHYSRYTDATRAGEARHHKITAGGGGAYLLGTQLLPDEIRLKAPNGPDAPKEAYTREAVYPDLPTSTRLKGGALTLARHNPSFALFMGGVYTVFAWFLQSASVASATDKGSFFDAAVTTMRDGRAFQGMLGTFWNVLADSPAVFAFALLFVLGMVAFCTPDVERLRFLLERPRLRGFFRGGIGALHGALHVLLAVTLTWLLVGLNATVLGLTSGDGWQGFGYSFLFAGEMMVAGGLLGAVLMSLFLLPWVNYNEAFSAQHLEGYKNFVRLNVRPDGTLKMYPYGVDSSVEWKFHPDAEPGEPYFDPETPPRVRLVDQVLTLSAPSAAG